MSVLNDTSGIVGVFSEGRSVRSLADQRRCSPREIEDAIRRELFDPRYIDRLVDLLTSIWSQHYSEQIDHVAILLLVLLCEKLDPDGYQELRQAMEVDEVQPEEATA